MNAPTPDQIYMEEHFSDCFDNYEREITARWIVRLCQKKGDWLPFTYAEIDEFHREGTGQSFLFNGIVTPEYGIEKIEGTKGTLYLIGLKFVVRLPTRLYK